METETDRAYNTSTVIRIAGEDIKPGDYVALFAETIEFPSFFWCCDTTSMPKDELIRVRCIPQQSGEPFKVLTVCLPFVYAKCAQGKLVNFDIRKHQLVKLDRSNGRKIWKCLKAIV